MPTDVVLDALVWLENSAGLFPLLMYKYLGNHPGVRETSVQYTTDRDCSLTLTRQHARVSLCAFPSCLPWNWGAKSKLPFRTLWTLECGDKDKYILPLEMSSPFCRQLRLDHLVFIWLKMGEMSPTAIPLVLIPFPPS